MRNISLIVAREYKERVCKKSFILTTLLMPLVMVAIAVAPTLMLMYGSSEMRNIIVVDHSGIVAQHLRSNDEVSFSMSENNLLQEELKRSLECEDFGVLCIGADVVDNPNNVQLYTNASSSLTLEESIAHQLEEIIEQERLNACNMGNLKEVMASVKADVSLSTFRNGDNEQSEASSSFVASIVGVLLGFVLYFFLAIYGSIVMQSIIEEKSSRVLEVLVSTVKPFDMMMGKILGVALVAITQIAAWGVLMVLTSGVVMPMLISEDVMTSVTAIQAGADMATLPMADVDAELVTAMASILDTAYIAEIVSLLLLFMVGGFLLYAAMYAAVGASVDQVQDAQQLMLPITIPIIVAFITTTMVMNDPNSPLVVWLSMIPFTSPIVMMARIPSGIATWEIVLSAVLLYATFVVMVWLAGKIYRVGIFMHGRKPSFKDLWRWIKMG